MSTLIREGFPMYCAHFPGGDPRRFEPDPDCCTVEEMLRWQAACEAAESRKDLAQLEGSAIYFHGGLGHLTMFGPGAYWYETDRFEGEDDGA